MNTSNHRNSTSDNEGIISETMENQDPALNQHQNESSSSDSYNSDSAFDGHNSQRERLDDNDAIDTTENSSNRSNQDAENDNDPDRRTLDEYNATQSEPEKEEEEE